LAWALVARLASAVVCGLILAVAAGAVAGRLLATTFGSVASAVAARFAFAVGLVFADAGRLGRIVALLFAVRLLRLIALGGLALCFGTAGWVGARLAVAG
jgi:hypothetical protein